MARKARGRVEKKRLAVIAPIVAYMPIARRLGVNKRAEKFKAKMKPNGRNRRKRMSGLAYLLSRRRLTAHCMWRNAEMASKSFGVKRASMRVEASSIKWRGMLDSAQRAAAPGVSAAHAPGK